MSSKTEFKKTIREQIRLLAFFDYAYGQLRGPSSDEIRARNLAGIGGGVQFALTDHLLARVEVGVPVGNDTITEGGHYQTYFRLQCDI